MHLVSTETGDFDKKCFQIKNRQDAYSARIKYDVPGDLESKVNQIPEIYKYE